MDQKNNLPFRPTTKMLVQLHAEGVLLANPFTAPSYHLCYSDLMVIGELNNGKHLDLAKLIDKVSRRSGVDREAVRLFVRHMRGSGRIRQQDSAATMPRLPAARLAPSRKNSWLDSGLIAIKVPMALRLFKDHFQVIDHDGNLVINLSARDVIALGQFVKPCSFTDGFEGQKEALGRRHAIRGGVLRKILTTLDRAGLVSWTEFVREVDTEATQLSRAQVNKQNFARQAAEQDAREAEREKETGVRRTKVIPIWFDEGVPAALGLVFAYAKAYDGGRLEDFYNFRLDWVWDDDRLPGYTEHPAIYLCSNYLWSHEKSIAISAKVKELSPNSITIHGGPDTPKYEQDSLDYFEQYPHVDIVIRGEGEASCADTLDKLQAVIGQENPDLSVLEGVPGISYRHNGKVIRNPDRERIADLDTIPSPYLTGLFDAFKGVPRLHVTLETNRGCPYGCTFCDWGSATTSKIRKFDIDRVYGEIEWCSKVKVQSVSQADANFGVFERDVSIAEKVAEFKTSTGYPEAFGGSYAKNSTKYLQKIIKVMADADILTQGVLSLQTMDDNTLAAIKRSNIKVDKYDALANEMRNSKLQLTVELMMGLPGATLDSFIDDLQQCIDRDIQARINHTTLLVNSPMNNPEYREEHQIETGTPLGPGKMPVLVSTSTYTRDELNIMLALRQVYMLLDNFGVLRLVSRFVRQSTGIPEMEFYQKLYFIAGAEDAESRWPTLNALVKYGQYIMAPMYSWALVIADVKSFLVEELGIPDDGALSSVLKAQHAILPSHDRGYPFVVELEHDVVAWHQQMLSTKAAGHWRDWGDIVPPLSEFPAGRLEVDDPGGAVTRAIGTDIEMSSNGVNWDMDSGVGRARVNQDFTPAWEAENLAETG